MMILGSTTYASKRMRRVIELAILLSAFATCVFAQSPWATMAERLSQDFSGPIARGLSIVAIVVGGLTVAFSEGGGRRVVGGILFGLGMALGAARFVSWLFS